MGKVLSETRLFVGGIHTEKSNRTNEVIVVYDYHDGEGYGVYVAFPWSDTDSFTTSFGDGALAELMSEQFYVAVRDYYSSILLPLPADTNLAEFDLDDSDFKDDQFKIEYKLDENKLPTSVVSIEESRLDGLPYVMNFILTHTKNGGTSR